MPELPDVQVYIERLTAHCAGKTLDKLRIVSPFVLRTFDPPSTEVHGKRVEGFSRLGKRIIFELEDELFIVVHLMIAGRLRWRKAGAAVPRGRGLAGFDFADGTLVFTEASKKKRASIHVVRGRDALEPFDRGGLEVMGADPAAFVAAMRRENHTLKRALTDPRILSGIGNAYSDEILLHARLSPFKQTRHMSDEELTNLLHSVQAVLEEWTERHRAAVGDGFPDKVTAFHDDMAVHGKYKQPCPVCGSPVQRIVYAENEANYCATCQTEGKVLADRALSRLLKDNWPRTLDELEALKDR